MKKVILDTSAYTGLLAGDTAVLEEISRAHKTYVPVIVLGELFAGFRGGKKFAQNKRLLEKFLQTPGVAVVDVTEETADIFGDLKNRLKKQGTPIPINDLWIAACTVETGATLITYDQHFQTLPGLRLWHPA